MEIAGAGAEPVGDALREAVRAPGDEPSGVPEPDADPEPRGAAHEDEPSGDDGGTEEEAAAPDDLMPAALRALSEANLEGAGPAVEEASAAEASASDFEAKASDGRHMPAEPQAGPPPYSGDETAFTEHEEDAPDHGLEPYADDEEPVVYDEEPDEAESAASAVTEVPDISEVAEDERSGEADEPAATEEEDPTEIAARALAMAESPVESMRRGQMAEIRQMLDELQTDSAAPGADAEAEAETAEAQSDPIPARPYEEDEYRDPLKERLAAVSGTTPEALKRAKKVKDYDRDKLIKRHQRRYRRKKIAEAKTRPNAFAAGFMLIVMVAALMTGVYLLHPQIIARVPDAEPALMSYVQMVDGFRGVVAEKMDALRLMVEETIEKAK